MTDRSYNENLEELLVRAKDGDMAARSSIVEENTGLVWSVVRRFSGRGHEMEDLFQIGCIGLIKAIQKFDCEFGVKFSTYAVPMIMGEIKRFIRDDGIIKVSRSLKELSGKAMTVREVMIREGIDEPGVRDIAQRLGVSAEELAAALEAGARPESIDAPVGGADSDKRTLIDKIESPFDYEADIINKILIKELMEEFSERDRKIIILRYFKQKTQSQIADLLGISQVQVSRIEKKLLEAMRIKIS